MVTGVDPGPHEYKRCLQAAQEALTDLEEAIDRYQIISQSPPVFPDGRSRNEHEERLKFAYIRALSEATELLTHVRDALDSRFGTRWRENGWNPAGAA